ARTKAQTVRAASSLRWTMNDRRQKTRKDEESETNSDLQLQLPFAPGVAGEAQDAAGGRVEAFVSPREHQSPTNPLTVEAMPPPVMQEVLQLENLERALAQVQANKGAPGMDGMTVK